MKGETTHEQAPTAILSDWWQSMISTEIWLSLYDSYKKTAPLCCRGQTSLGQIGENSEMQVESIMQTAHVNTTVSLERVFDYL